MTAALILISLLIVLPLIGIAYLRPRYANAGKPTMTQLSRGEVVVLVVGASIGTATRLVVADGWALVIGIVFAAIGISWWRKRAEEETGPIDEPDHPASQ